MLIILESAKIKYRTTIYKYLGIYLHENINFEDRVEILSKYEGRAFGVSKLHGNKSFGYQTYTNFITHVLFQS